MVNPDTEILVTHGGVEALTLALLACTAPGDRVALTDPSYMLYQRALLTLGRQPDVFLRPLRTTNMLPCSGRTTLLCKGCAMQRR